MKQLYRLYHLSRADFLERTRRYSFLVTLLVIVVVTYLYLPAVDDIAWIKLNLGSARPIYNSAWIGIAVAALMAEFFPLFGFYLVKNTIERDRRTGVGEIIATTPISRPLYTIGKWLSNVAVFGTIIVVTILISLVLQFVRAEDFTIDLWALGAPFLFLILPELVFIAALAVLFETISWLRGGFGNLIYYVVYAIAVLAGNLQGIAGVWRFVYEACAASYTQCKQGRQIDIGGLPLANLPTFRFDGVDWTFEVVFWRFAWIVISIAVALCAAFFFHRFDPSRIGQTPFARLKQMVQGFVLEPRPAVEDAKDAEPVPTTAPRMTLSSLPIDRQNTATQYLFLRTFIAELRLTFKGTHGLWYLFALGVVIASLFTSMEITRLVMLPLAMVLPVLVWSSLGVREVEHHTAPIVFTFPHALRRQLFVSWLIGLFIALAMASGVIVRLALVGDGVSCLAVIIGALFVPSLALALGCWSGSSKLFQAVYLFVWYLAAVQGVIFIDFMGHFPQTVALGIPWLVAIVTIGLLLAAAYGRQRQVYR
jgi:ABC-type transport system involved in multi-copper enzyme maturation permease subunit